MWHACVLIIFIYKLHFHKFFFLLFHNISLFPSSLHSSSYDGLISWFWFCDHFETMYNTLILAWTFHCFCPVVLILCSSKCIFQTDFLKHGFLLKSNYRKAENVSDRIFLYHRQEHRFDSHTPDTPIPHPHTHDIQPNHIHTHIHPYHTHT